MNVLATWGLALAMAQDPDKKIQDLERQVQEMQKQIAELKQTVQKSAPPGNGAVQSQITELQKQVDSMKYPEGKTPVTFEFKDGLKFESADGNTKGHIGGRFLEHARFSTGGEDAFGVPVGAPAGAFGDRRPDGFFIRQARLEMSGLFYNQFEFKVQYDAPTAAVADSGTIQDGYIGWMPMPEFNIRFGQMKEPFSQEETTSTRFIDFVERSVMNRLTPARDIGVMFHGKLLDGQVGYEAGFFNGQGRGVFDNDDEKDFAARIQAYPFKTIDSIWTKNLRLGIAGTFGSVDNDSVYPDYTSPETTLRWLDVDGTVVHDGDRERFGAELAWLIGPVGLRGEWMVRSTEVREIFPVSPITGVLSASVPGDIHDDGWYLAATWLVTGEDKTMESRTVPAEPFDIEKGTFGAFELALRIAQTSVENDVFDDAFATSLVAAGSNNSNKINALTAGFNWYLTRNFRTSFDYVHNWMADDVLIGPTRRDDEENVFLMRFQIDF